MNEGEAMRSDEITVKESNDEKKEFEVGGHPGELQAYRKRLSDLREYTKLV